MGMFLCWLKGFIIYRALISRASFYISCGIESKNSSGHVASTSSLIVGSRDDKNIRLLFAISIILITASVMGTLFCTGYWGWGGGTGPLKFKDSPCCIANSVWRSGGKA